MVDQKVMVREQYITLFLKPPLAILDLPCPFIIPFFGLSTSLVPQPFHFLSISLDNMERIQPNLVWLIWNTLTSPIFSSPELKAHKVGL